MSFSLMKNVLCSKSGAIQMSQNSTALMGSLQKIVSGRFFSIYSQSQSEGNRGVGTLWHATTILSVRKNNKVAVIGDGQVSMGSVIVKPNAKKVRRIGPNRNVIAGFAGATADAFTLFERLENKLEEYPDQLLRACVSLAKDWRMDKYLRRLDALLLVSDKDISLTLTGMGDVLEPQDGIIGIGSGGNYAIAAARALIDIEGIEAEEIARKAMKIASDLCVYTNDQYTVEVLDLGSEPKSTNEKNNLSRNENDKN